MQNPRGEDMKRLPVTVRSLDIIDGTASQRRVPVTVREWHCVPGARGGIRMIR